MQQSILRFFARRSGFEEFPDCSRELFRARADESVIGIIDNEESRSRDALGPACQPASILAHGLGDATGQLRAAQL
jgi:hypothetical protein